jgi:SAM-dependent methyltransferase
MVLETIRRRRLRTGWDRRAGTWHGQVRNSQAFGRVADELLSLANPQPSDHCLDLGAGTGFITLPLARRVHCVGAIDISSAMLELLTANAKAAGVENIRTQVADLGSLSLPEGCADLVVSSYAFHSLTDAQKRRLLSKILVGLRPGGRLVVADMMMGRGFTSRDRAILRSKARLLMVRGPAGAWRLAKNASLIFLGLGENRPASPDWWQDTLRTVGFVVVTYQDVVSEAGIVYGCKPW